jgi:hypothetical protein
LRASSGEDGDLGDDVIVDGDDKIVLNGEESSIDSDNLADPEAEVKEEVNKNIPSNFNPPTFPPENIPTLPTKNLPTLLSINLNDISCRAEASMPIMSILLPLSWHLHHPLRACPLPQTPKIVLFYQ